jgi:excisionase family DNA binding protein
LKQEKNMEEKLLTVEELAKQLKVPKSWVYGKTRIKGEDQIPCVRVGKYVRFRMPDVVGWLEHRVEGQL